MRMKIPSTKNSPEKARKNIRLKVEAI